MALKFKYQRKEEIPAEHLGLYAEREGAWQLDVDGVADKAKLDEFRQSNVTLLKQGWRHADDLGGVGGWAGVGCASSYTAVLPFWNDLSGARHAQGRLPEPNAFLEVGKELFGINHGSPF